jgi:hypothetical protein
MAREFEINNVIWKDPEFCALSVEERVAFLGFVAEAEDTAFMHGVSKIDRTLELALFRSLQAKGLIRIPEPSDNAGDVEE